MRYKLTFITTVVGILFLTACNDKGFFSEQAPNALNGLNDLKQSPEYSLDWINGDQIRPGENTIPAGEDIEIVGWTMDPIGKKAASKVYLSLNGTLFTTEYGVERSDVANHFGIPAYLNSGFRAKLSRSLLQPGVYTIDVKVVNAEGTAYYSSPPERSVVIKL